MPEKSGDKLISRTVALPKKYWEDLAELAGESLSINETIRTAVNRGVLAMQAEELSRITRENKLLVREKLRWRNTEVLKLFEELAAKTKSDNALKKTVDKIRKHLGDQHN